MHAFVTGIGGADNVMARVATNMYRINIDPERQGVNAPADMISDLRAAATIALGW
jgi:hypothetical protein